MIRLEGSGCIETIRYCTYTRIICGRSIDFWRVKFADVQVAANVSVNGHRGTV